MVEIVEVCESIEKNLMQQCLDKCVELCNCCTAQDCSTMCSDGIAGFYDECIDYMVMAFHAELDEIDEEEELDEEDEEEE